MSEKDFATDAPLVVSEARKEKWGISEEELRGEDPEAEDSEEEESDEFKGASLSELAASDEFRKKWAEEHRRKRREYEEADSEEEEQKLKLAEAFEKRGGAWSEQAEELREEVEGTEAEKIAEEIAKRLNSAGIGTEELAEGEDPEAEDSEDPLDDSIFIEEGEEGNGGTLLTSSTVVKEETRFLDEREDSVTIISENEGTMEARFEDKNIVKEY